jgi:16S rRNA (uracil1498-N3)-methyltransferase
MARRRFYASLQEIDGETITLLAEEAHHLVHVLRMKTGDEAFVFDGLGGEYRCRVRSTLGRVELQIIDRLADQTESPLELTLAQALVKGDKFDLIVQKATELGVTRVVPLATDHTDVRLSSEGASKRLERWRRISLEALKQCGRRRLVEMTTPQTVGQLLEANTAAGSALLVFSEKGGLPLRDAISAIGPTRSVFAVVGPEGGWSEAELLLMRQRGARAVTLGPRVLRTETAAIVVIAILQHLLGDLSA